MAQLVSLINENILTVETADVTAGGGARAVSAAVGVDSVVPCRVLVPAAAPAAAPAAVAAAGAASARPPPPASAERRRWIAIPGADRDDAGSVISQSASKAREPDGTAEQ